MKRLLLGFLALGVAEARPWSEDVLYFVMTDRFRDGDPGNNVPVGSDPELYDPTQTDLGRYHGGDLRGLEQALAAGYFNELGITAIWITPPVRNVWRSGFDLGGWKSGYHGYWTQDFLDIDPHLTSETSMEGRKYPAGAEGRMQHYRDFVKLAHSKGIKVVQDVVLNHAGPVFFYDVNGDGVFDTVRRDEWVQPYRESGFHDNAVWGDIDKWNLKRTMPDGPRRLLGRRIATRGVLSELSSYGRKGFSGGSLGKNDGEEVMCDFFSLRDLWTKGGSKHFDRLVDEFVEIYAFYLRDVGVDGLRVDTVKHAHHEFWDAFTERLRKKLGSAAKEKIFFGEVYDGNPARLGQYTWRSDAPGNDDPCLDSLLAFQLCFAMRDYLRKPGNEFGNARAIEGAMLAFQEGRFPDGRLFYNRTPGPDGLNSVQKSITFIENHDGLNRFRVQGVTERRHELAQAMVMTLPGIPCVYYGSEIALYDQNGRIGQDSESGRMMLWRNEEAPMLKELRERSPFRVIAGLSRARERWPVLRHGEFRSLWVDGSGPEDDGVFAYIRETKEQSVAVVFNLSDKPARTGRVELGDGFASGAELVAEALVGEVPEGAQVSVGKDLTAVLPVGASSAVMYRVSK